MRTSRLFRCLPNRPGMAASRGFAIVSAIFLLVVLVALGAAMLNVATVQHVSSQRDLQGARAYQAARAGIEWALYEQLRGGGACAAGPVSFALPTGTTLSSFTVSVRCDSRTYNSAIAVDGIQLAPGAVPIGIFHIIAVACNQPAAGNCPAGANRTADYVERQLEATFRQ